MTDPTTAGGPAAFAARVNQIHVPEPNADRERYLLVGGFVVIGLGAIAILVAWYQVSGTTNVGVQMPYAVSGGLLGLAMVVLGSALVIRFSLARLFRYWLARIVHEHQVQTDRTVEALGRIEALLAAGTPSPPPAVDVTANSDSSEPTRRVRREPLRADPLEK